MFFRRQSFFCLMVCCSVLKTVAPAVMPVPVAPAASATPVSVAPVQAQTAAKPVVVAVPVQVVPVQAVPVQAVPAGAAPAAPVASAAPAASKEKEFEELYQKLNQVSGIKKELKQQLAEIEEKLDVARKMSLESKEVSFKIIQQAKISDAEVLVAQVDKNLQSLSEMQKRLTDIDLPKFEESAKKIQEIMQVIQSKIAELESKGLKFQISQAQLELQKKSTVTKEVTPEVVGAVQPVTEKAQAEKTFTQKTYDYTADMLAAGISKTKKTWKRFKKWVYSSPEESDDVKKNSKNVVLQSEADIKNVIGQLDGVLKQLDDMQIGMLQKYSNIKSNLKNLEIILKSNDEIFKYFEMLDEQRPVWKEAVVNSFSSAVDSAYTIAMATKKTGKIFYDKFLKSFVNDVKNKVHEQDNSADNPAAPAEATPSQATPPVAAPEMQIAVVK